MESVTVVNARKYGVHSLYVDEACTSWKCHSLRA